MNKEAIAYRRVSSEEQADSGLGLEAQRDRIQAFCKLKGLTLARDYVDAGVSGGKPLASRPEGAKLLADARKTKAVVIVAKFDRLFRSVADAAETIADFDKKEIELVAISEGFDMTNPYGRAMAQMASVFAELERAMIRERTKSAMNVKRERGERISGHAPYGWDFSDDGKLLVNASEQEAIRTICQLRTQGHTLRAIAAILDEKGISPKRGQQWRHKSVRAIIQRHAA